MSPKPAVLSEDQLAEELRTLPAWSGDTTAIKCVVEAPSFPAGIELVRRVAEVAEEMNHHPDIDIRWRRVTFALSTHVSGGVTAFDIALARRIDEQAADLA